MLRARARSAPGRGSAESSSVVARRPANADDRPLGERLGDVDVEVARVGVVHRRRHVLPVVGSAAGISSAAASTIAVSSPIRSSGARNDRPAAARRRRAAPPPRRVAISASSRCSSASSAAGVELDPLGLAERALGEGREPADRLDLVAEQLEPRGAVLGRREDVEDVAADRELAALLDLVGALVAGLDQQLGDVAEVDLLAACGARSPPGAARRPGPPRRARRRWRRRSARSSLVAALGGERVERADPQADQVRRRRQVRLVAGPARRVVADPARRQVGAERAGEVAGADVVGGDDQRRAPARAPRSESSSAASR